MNLHVGVLHYDPSFEPFPLLMDPVEYEPNTLNIREDKPMLHYWLNVLQDSIQTIMAKAMASEGATTGMSAAPRRYALMSSSAPNHAWWPVSPCHFTSVLCACYLCHAGMRRCLLPHSTMLCGLYLLAISQVLFVPAISAIALSLFALNPLPMFMPHPLSRPSQNSLCSLAQCTPEDSVHNQHSVYSEP